MRAATTILLFSVLGLAALGMVMLFSASTGRPEASYLVMQPIWCGAGLVVCTLAAGIDYRWLKRSPWIPAGLMLIMIGLLVCVLVPSVGVKINGAKRWLRVAGFTMQPSELAKVVLIITLAYYGERNQRQMPSFFRGMVIPGLIVGLVLGLIFLEPDVGSAVLLGCVSAIMLLVAGIRWRYFFPPVLVVLLALGAFIWNNPMRSERIYSWWHLEETKLGKGLQAYQAQVALGSGGLTGVGLGDGRQKLGFVPEHHTDFIYSVVGEELGLVTTLLVLFAFAAILWSGVYIAWHARDTFGLLLGTGLSFLIVLQALINIGVVTGALPNKGLALPFISYGGSNMVVMLACVGLLLNVARQSGGGERVLSSTASQDDLAAVPLS